MNNKVWFLLVVTLFFNYALFAKQVPFNSCTEIANKRLEQLGKLNEYLISNSSEILTQDGENVLFCVFELYPQGYIVTTSESNLPPIIAYSYNSNFYDEKNGNILMNMLKTDISLRLENIPNLPKEVISKRNEAWLKILVGNIEKNRFEQWPPEGTTPTGGWLLENWTQSAPYNNFCPMDPVTGNRSIAGSPSIAMAQILNLHRTVNNVYFDDLDDYYHSYAGRQYWIDDDYSQQDFLSFPEMNVNLDTLAFHYLYEEPVTNADKATLVFACGVAAQQAYTSQSSGTFGVDQAHQAYLKFNFDNVQLIDETTPDFYEQIAQNMIDGFAVHFASVTPAWDAGHNFVIDGYNSDEYYHINFGWGGSYDGWFYTDDITPGTSQFTFAQELIKDIYPDTNLYTYPQTCNGFSSLEYSSGSVEDGSGINNYEPNSDCTWQINPTCGLIVDAYLDEFNLEADDTLFIYDGNESQNTLIDYFVKDSAPKLSWMSVPDLYSAKSGELMINFKSDNSVEARGWKISYFADFCKFGLTETDSVGTIEDGSEICNYEPNTGCKWTIQPVGAEAIRINFTEFNLDTNNTYDNVRIFKDAAGGSNELAKFTIDNLPTEIIVPSGVAVITFTTSPTSSGGGWSLDYETTVLENIEVLQDDNISVFPNPTSGLLNIESYEKINNILVQDICGRILLSKKTDSFNTIIDVSELQKGIYLINVDNYITKIILE
jgi:hypothetical protein